MKGRTAIAKILKMEGVEFVSGFPQNDIFEAGAEEGIRCIIARTERVGGEYRRRLYPGFQLQT